jgi:hypothetical protein
MQQITMPKVNNDGKATTANTTINKKQGGKVVKAAMTTSSGI